MHTRQSSTTHFRAAGFAVLLPLLLLAGCGKDRSAATAPDVQLTRAEGLRKPAAAMPPPSTLKIYTARPQAELDALLSAPSSYSAGPSTPAPRAAIPMRLPADDGRVVAEPGWDVNISREWRHIVIHHSASATGSAASFDKAHRERGWDGLGYHFVIGNGTGSRDGEVEIGYRWSRQMQGAHAGNAEYNQAGIGICLVGNFQHDGRPTQAQMLSMRQLVRFLQVKTGVPTSEIVGHGNVPGKSTECPGQYLDLAAFRASLGSGAIGVPIEIARSKPATSPTRIARVPANRSSASMP